jgi:hypothetical protein
MRATSICSIVDIPYFSKNVGRAHLSVVAWYDVRAAVVGARGGNLRRS